MKREILPHQLYYTRPAKAFEEALPLGNGRLGATVYGGTDTDRISINEDTLWTGYPHTFPTEGRPAAFKQVQALVLEGRIAEAEEMIEQSFNSSWSQAYTAPGSIYLTFSHRQVTDYVRTLDLDSAQASVSYTADGVHYTRTYLVSHPHDCLAIRLTADQPDAISFSVTARSLLHTKTVVEQGLLITRGVCPSHIQPNGHVIGEQVVYRDAADEKGICFTQAVSVCLSGGSLTADGDTLTVTNASEAVLYLNLYTSFNGFDKHPNLEAKEHFQRTIDAVRTKSLSDWPAIVHAHQNDYQALYGRVSFSLKPDDVSKDYAALPTDERLRRFDGTDTGLYTLLFHFGRYLTIASSRPGTQASTLQGIWNEHLVAPWNSNYTVNINTEMNYWPVHICNLSECVQPLIELVNKVRVTGKKTARDFYEAGGFVSHHNIDLWGHSVPVGVKTKGSSQYSFWPMSSGWLCCQLYDCYLYTGDMALLSDSIYPAMKEACEFYLQMLITDPQTGRLILCPSTSPENRYELNGAAYAVAKTTTMTTSILYDLFTRTAQASEILDIDPEFRTRLKSAAESLPPLQIGDDGRLMEWPEQYADHEPHHRHVSHLYPLFPGTQITPMRTPELAEACAQSLRVRGDDGTGWSLGWKIILWAMLKDGDHALRLLDRQLRYVEPVAAENYMSGGGTYPNLFDAHPPFQIDGNFAATTGIAQMLLYSESGYIQLLPALPKRWMSGQFSGLVAKGGIQVSAEWDAGRLTHATLCCDREQTVTVAYSGSEQRIRLMPGEVVSLS